MRSRRCSNVVRASWAAERNTKSDKCVKFIIIQFRIFCVNFSLPKCVSNSVIHALQFLEFCQKYLHSPCFLSTKIILKSNYLDQQACILAKKAAVECRTIYSGPSTLWHPRSRKCSACLRWAFREQVVNISKCVRKPDAPVRSLAQTTVWRHLSHMHETFAQLNDIYALQLWPHLYDKWCEFSIFSAGSSLWMHRSTRTPVWRQKTAAVQTRINTWKYARYA
jgi:hypothetical protein